MYQLDTDFMLRHDSGVETKLDDILNEMTKRVKTMNRTTGMS